MAENAGPHVEVYRAQIDSIVLDTLTQLGGVYVDLGYSHDTTEKEFTTLVEEAREFFHSKLLPKLALREQLEKEVLALQKIVEGTIDDLGNPPAEAERFKSVKALPLHLQTEQLNKLNDELLKQLQQRIASLQALHEKLHSLYAALDATPHPNFVEIGSPTIRRVIEYEEHIKSLEEELDKIKNNIDKYRVEIIEMWKLIDGKDAKHDSELDKFIVDPTKSKLKVSRATFGLVEELHTKLSLEKEKRMNLKQKYLDGIKQLYISLQIPETEEKRVAFEKKDISGINDDVMAIVKTEHDRLYSVKKDRLKSLIAKSKAKLEHLWKELHFSDEQKEQFYAKTKSNDDYDDAYNDEHLLELMDAEIVKLEKLLEAIGDILKMIVRREWIKSEMHKFEKSASDPNRLFGSSLKLLEEEKFRKIVAKEFPKLTDDLRKKIGEFEKQNNGERLMFQGFPYLDTMNQEKENPNFKLMHLRLLMNGSDTEITENDITVSSTPREKDKDKEKESKEKDKLASPVSTRPSSASARSHTSKPPTTPVSTRPSTATTPKLQTQGSSAKLQTSASTPKMSTPKLASIAPSPKLSSSASTPKLNSSGTIKKP